jgi:hypothetical protein
MARIHSIPAHRVNWKTMKGPGDFSPPEYPEGPECEECGHEMTEDTYAEVYECTNEECGHTEQMPEDPRISQAEDEREYGGMDW